MQVNSNNEIIELDFARMKYLVSRIKKTEKTKRRVVIILAAAIGLLLVSTVCYLIPEFKEVQEAMSSVLVPYILGLIFSYISFDTLVVDRYYSYFDEYYNIGCKYFTIADINKVNENGPYIDTEAKWVKYKELIEWFAKSLEMEKK